MVVWGSNSEGQLGLETQHQLSPEPLQLDQLVVAVACGYYHTLALTGELHASCGKLDASYRKVAGELQVNCGDLHASYREVAAASYM